MAAVQSWATLLLACAFPIAILRILWLLTHPTKTCHYCDRGYRGHDFPVLDGRSRPIYSTCSQACCENATEAAWYASEQTR